jgi:hypothetical protein
VPNFNQVEELVKNPKRRHGNPRIKDLGISTQFQPGRSGNPGGRPKARTLAEMLAAVGDQVEKESGKTYFQLAAEALVSRASDDDVQAFREFADRIDGRATQSVELSGVNGQPIAIDSTSAWKREWDNSSYERRQEMAAQLDDRILAMAETIRAKRNSEPTDETRYREWMRQYSTRTAAGEDQQAVRESMGPFRPDPPVRQI